MEEVKRKRGRPRKNPDVPKIPEEIKSIIEEVQEKQEERRTALRKSTHSCIL